MRTHPLTASLTVLYVSHATVVRSTLKEHNLLVGSIFSGAMRTFESIQTAGDSMTLTRSASILLDIV